MTRMLWDVQQERTFEFGVDRGVFYPQDGDGVPWNGLSSVTESPDGAEPKSYYLDGVKYLNIFGGEDFAGTIEAYNAPREMSQYDGLGSVGGGLFIGQQPRKPFGMVYRSKIGAGLDNALGYKLHLAYNVLVSPSENKYETVSDSTELMVKSWTFTTTPVVAAGYRPSAHLILDSRMLDPFLLADLEDILYGANGLAPRLPPPSEIMSIMAIPNRYGTSWYGTANASASKLVNLRTGVHIADNLLTNPSCESSSGNVEVRRNLIQNPLGTSPSSSGWTLYPQWGGTGGTFTGSTESTSITLPDGQVIPSFRRKTWTVVGTDAVGIAWQFYANPNNNAPVTAGATYTIQYAYRHSWTATPLTNRWEIKFFDTVTSTTQIGTTQLINISSDPSGGVATQIFITFTVPVGASYVQINHSYSIPVASLTVGSTFDATAVLVEVAPVKLPFFAPGVTSYDSDLTPSWTGTANQSASILSGVGVANKFGGGGISSSQWFSSGAKSLRIIPTAASANNDTYSDFSFAAVAGRTYTASATLRLSAAQSGTLHAFARKIKIISSNGTAYSSGSSSAASNAAGLTRLSVTWTVPSDATLAFVRLYNGASIGNGDVWWDDLVLVEGVYTGPYFDGSNVPVDADW